MRAVKIIEKNFWIFMISGIIIGLIWPQGGKQLVPYLELLLMTMLFLVFLKIDLMQVLHNIKNIKLMLYLVVMSLLVIPAIVYALAQLFDQNLAIGLLLLTAMPAGTASPALTDILKGNNAMAMSLTIVSSLLAPFTVPVLFTLFKFSNIEVDGGGMFKTLAVIVFVPMVCSQMLKCVNKEKVKQVDFSFSAINIILIFFIVYAAIGYQSDVILSNYSRLLGQLVGLYIVFVGLHGAGYYMVYKMDRKTRVAVAITHTYMNNSIAIILAAAFFHPSVLILAVLSELPWNTLLPVFKLFLRWQKEET